jgi:hypothetical protein
MQKDTGCAGYVYACLSYLSRVNKKNRIKGGDQGEKENNIY